MTVKQVPLVDYLHIGARPYLKAKACTSCGAPVLRPTHRMR